MSIFLDPFGLRPPDSGDFLVTDTASYVEARRRLLAYKRGTMSAEPVIVVRDGVRAHWFGDVSTQLVQPLQQLQARYPDVMLPADLTDDDVLTLNLLGSVLTDADIEPTESVLLNHFFGNRLNPSPTTPETVYPLVQFVVEQPIQFWNAWLVRNWVKKLQTTDALAAKILTPVKALNQAICRALGEGLYLANWSTLFDDWLHTDAPMVKMACDATEAELRQFMERMTRIATENQVLERRVEQHAKQLLMRSPMAWRTWPARYRAELNAIVAVGLPLEPEQLTALLTTYADLLTTDLRRQLSALVPPVLTDAPDLAGMSLPQQAASWQRWAVEQFIPYKFWLDDLKKENRSADALARMERLSTHYAHWLYDNYQALLDRDDVLTNQNVRSRVADLSGTSRVIWLIIDGFPAAFVPLLQDVLTQHGLAQQTTDWAFAPLPTITKIGIPVLLNGLRPDAASFVWDNNVLALKQAFPGQDTVFTTAPRDFLDSLRTDADIICLHWGEIDALLHKPDHHFERSRADEIKRLIDSRIEQIAREMKQSVRKTRLLIATDHGATKCLRNEMGIRNRKLADAAADRPKERCIRLGGKIKPEHVDEEETRLLHSTMTHNPDDWAAAWGYRYFGTNDHGYRHGGLTPEETIVPVILAEVGSYAFVMPQIADLTGKALTLGNREKDFTIQLRNPNDYPLVIQALTIGEDSHCRFELPVTIPPQGIHKLTTPLKLSRNEKAKQGRLVVHLNATYQAQDKVFTENTTLSVAIKSNEIDDFDFDGL